MTSFARYHKDRKLIEISMDMMEKLIKSESNKEIIAEHVYERLYTRFLKIFDFENELKAHNEEKNVFKKEYKNGFLILASCSLLIETFAAFINGENETPGGKASNRFNKVFEYAKEKNNPLKIFENSEFYKKIRCGILHQGETKGKFLVTRDKDKQILDGETVNANLFHAALRELLNSYRSDLETKDWDSWIWDACRQKIRHIIANSKD